MPRWRVDFLGKVRSTLGAVEAADEKSAVAEAVRQFHITPARRIKVRVTQTRAAEKHEE
jgi:hypothetical protein